MGFTIPNVDTAAWTVQSHIFEADIAILAAAYAGYRVVSGAGVTPQGSPDMTVAVASGRIRPGDETLVDVASGNLTIGTADAALFRIDLISASSAGVKTVTAGTAAAVDAVKPPALPAGHTALAFVTVPPTATAISADEIVDKRPFMAGPEPIDPVDHGSIGATETFDYAAGSDHKGTLDANPTITLAGPSSTVAQYLFLHLTEDGTGGHINNTIWDPSIVWEGGTVPSFDDSPGAETGIAFWSDDGAVTWHGFTKFGAAGPTGGAIAIPYTFSTTTTDADPGNGKLRLSNATQDAATVIRADLLASDGTDWSAVLATLADSTNTVKGHIRLFKTDDPTKWLVFTVSALASPSGYNNITVANVAGSTASPFADTDAITLAFTRAGDAGGGGSGGGLLAVTSYDPTIADTAVSATSLTDLDATHLSVVFTAPASGNVLVRLTCGAYAEAAGAVLLWGLREATTNITPAAHILGDGPSGPWVVCSRSFLITGISAGSHTYKWAVERKAANCNMRYGGDYGPAVMEVWAAP